jgi:tetratricopeptide (TPR) repeat protein
MEIVQKAVSIDRTDFFAMLDLPRDATKDEIETAFFSLAKRWHPDRLPPELAPVRDACNRVFSRMSEAHRMLVDDEQRARYIKVAADGSGTPEMQDAVAKVVEAAGAFQKAEVCFKRNDLGQAEGLCRRALELDDTQADYHALLAWLIAMKPESQSAEGTQICIQMLDRAIGMSQKCEKAFFWRGLLYKRLGKAGLALRDFRKVAELNPRNIDAVREVRLHTMRGGSQRDSSPPPAAASGSTAPSKADDGKPGLLGRLFKKP